MSNAPTSLSPATGAIDMSALPPALSFLNEMIVDIENSLTTCQWKHAESMCRAALSFAERHIKTLSAAVGAKLSVSASATLVVLQLDNLIVSLLLAFSLSGGDKATDALWQCESMLGALIKPDLRLAERLAECDAAVAAGIASGCIVDDAYRAAVAYAARAFDKSLDELSGVAAASAAAVTSSSASGVVNIPASAFAPVANGAPTAAAAAYDRVHAAALSLVRRLRSSTGSIPERSSPSDLDPHLVAEVRRGNCVAFVGAGFSMPAGFPSWDGLLRNVLQKAIDLGRATLQSSSSSSSSSSPDTVVAQMGETHATLIRELIQKRTADSLDRAAQMLSDHLGADRFDRLIRDQLQFKSPSRQLVQLHTLALVCENLNTAFGWSAIRLQRLWTEIGPLCTEIAMLLQSDQCTDSTVQAASTKYKWLPSASASASASVSAAAATTAPSPPLSDADCDQARALMARVYRVAHESTGQAPARGRTTSKKASMPAAASSPSAAASAAAAAVFAAAAATAAAIASNGDPSSAGAAPPSISVTAAAAVAASASVPAAVAWVSGADSSDAAAAADSTDAAADAFVIELERRARSHCIIQSLSSTMRRRLELISKIPFRAILTTNYDLLLCGTTPFQKGERGFRQVLRPEKNEDMRSGFDRITDTVVEMVREADAQVLEYHFKCPVIQLHGSLADEHHAVVVTRRGYRQLLHATAGYRDFLHSVMSTCTLLYLGFSFTDYYLNDLRSSVLATLEGKKARRDAAGAEGRSTSPHSAAASAAASVSLASPLAAARRPSPRNALPAAAPALVHNTSMAALVQRTPIAYAVIPDQSSMDEEFLRAHEGVQVLSWNTLGGRDWDGFDRYLASIHFQTSIHVHLGRKLINKRILICDYGRLAEQGMTLDDFGRYLRLCVAEFCSSDLAMREAEQKRSQLMNATSLAKRRGGGGSSSSSSSGGRSLARADASQFVCDFVNGFRSCLNKIKAAEAARQPPYDVIVSAYGYNGESVITSMGELVKAIREEVSYAHWAPVIAYSMETQEARNHRNHWHALRDGAVGYAAASLMKLLSVLDQVLGLPRFEM